MKQIDFLKQAIQLAEDNPMAEIHFCVSNELTEDEYGWTDHSIYKVVLGWWYEDCERILTDPEEVQELLSDWWDRDVSEEEALEEMKPAILIYTRP